MGHCFLSICQRKSSILLRRYQYSSPSERSYPHLWRSSFCQRILAHQLPRLAMLLRKTKDGNIFLVPWASLCVRLSQIIDTYSEVLQTFSMFIGRIIFFRLHESPRYLVHAGRPHDAIKSLQMISRFNGSELSIELDDVRDHHHPITEVRSSRARADSRTVFDAGLIEGSRPMSTDLENGSSSPSPLTTIYSSTGESPKRNSPPLTTPTSEDPANENESAKEPPPRSMADTTSRPTPREMMARRSSTASARSSVISQTSSCRFLPRWLRRPLRSWWTRVMMVLEPEWRRTTILVWSAWCAMSLGK